ncbi:hypothetical protein Hanom_Chr02g00173041 [Helianthus anomalus]
MQCSFNYQYLIHSLQGSKFAGSQIPKEKHNNQYETKHNNINNIRFFMIKQYPLVS